MSIKLKTLPRKIGNSSHYTITNLYYSACGCSIIGVVIYLTTGFHLLCQVSIKFSFSIEVTQVCFQLDAGEMVLSANQIEARRVPANKRASSEKLF